MGSRKAHITNDLVKKMQVGETIWDTEITGFGIRCQKRDKIYVFNKRIKGKRRQFSICKHGEPYTAKKARDKAVEYLAAIKAGKDPAKIREDEKDKKTVADLCDFYLDHYAPAHLKPRSISADTGNINNHIKPLLGDRLIEDVSKADLNKFMRDVKAGKTAKAAKPNDKGGQGPKGGEGAANRALAMLSIAFSLADDEGWCSGNPTNGVKKFKREKKERFLSTKEISAISDAMTSLESEGMNKYAIYAIKLLIFTGARRNEILALKWSNIDFDRRQLTLEKSKTGPKIIHLNPPALEILATIPKQKNNPYVICGAIAGEHLVNLRKSWGYIKEKATINIWRQADEVAAHYESFVNDNADHNRLDHFQTYLEPHKISPEGGVMDVRIHDLRHTFASIGAAGGFSLPIIGKLLGHSQSATTARYAHLSDNPLKQANDAIGNLLQGLMSPTKTVNIIKLVKD